MSDFKTLVGEIFEDIAIDHKVDSDVIPRMFNFFWLTRSEEFIRDEEDIYLIKCCQEIDRFLRRHAVAPMVIV